MSRYPLDDLQASVLDKSAFSGLDDYAKLCKEYLTFVTETKPTRIVSPNSNNYIFYQYGKRYGNKITRPVNTDLFITDAKGFRDEWASFRAALGDLGYHQDRFARLPDARKYLENGSINRMIYTLQQSVGCIGDSFDNPNQTRKRIGQLFETLIKLVIKQIGLECESRTINIPIPGYDGYEMSYELDVVFSRDKAIIAAETKHIHAKEIVGSVKTTSKDRIDKVFLDKYLLTKLLGRPVPVVAVFLHDVQRAIKGESIFGINSTFKSNHFLGYTVALNKLDGVYYVDPRPNMLTDPRLKEQIHDFQQFITRDIWTLSA